MWIFAVQGFVSVVEVRGQPDTLLIRGRSRKDIVTWGRLVRGHGPIQRTPHMDYGWRFTAPRKEFALAMARVIGGIRYPNFKGAIGEKDRERALLYGEVWAAMTQLEE